MRCSSLYKRRPLLAWGLAFLLAGCAPALDWRQVRAGPVAVDLPCRPSVYERRLPLAGAQPALRLQACSAAGVTWAVADAELEDPARVTPALVQLAQASSDNTAGRRVRDDAWHAAGAPPNPQARRIVVEGRLPDGRGVRQHAVVFAVATRVVQLSVVGSVPVDEDVDTFFASVRVSP